MAEGGPPSTPPTSMDIGDLATSMSTLLQETPKSSRRSCRINAPRKNLLPRFHEQASQSPMVTEEQTSGPSAPLPKWTEAELKCLTEFIMLYTEGKKWISHKNMNFWNQAAVYIQQLLQTFHRRTGKNVFMRITIILILRIIIGSACRLKVTTILSKRFASPARADEHYRNVVVSDNAPPVGTRPHSSLPDVIHGTAEPLATHQWASVSITQVQPPIVDSRTVCKQSFVSLGPDEQRSMLSELFSLYMSQTSSARVPPADFIELAVKGMECTHRADRSNVIYLLSKALGTTLPDGSDSLLPVSRMPMGLLEYIVNFFTASSTNHVI